jgi:hypothetical protein
VLTAASLALAVEMAGRLYENPLADASTMRALLCGLAASAGCLWFSLIASIAHNFIESAAQHEDSLAEDAESLLKVYNLVAKSVTKSHTKPDIGEAVDEELAPEKHGGTVDETWGETLRTLEAFKKRGNQIEREIAETSALAEREASQIDIDKLQWAKAMQHTRRAEYWRKLEFRISISAVSLFVFGYLWAVAYVIVLRR